MGGGGVLTSLSDVSYAVGWCGVLYIIADVINIRCVIIYTMMIMIKQLIILFIFSNCEKRYPQCKFSYLMRTWWIYKFKIAQRGDINY